MLILLKSTCFDLRLGTRQNKWCWNTFVHVATLICHVSVSALAQHPSLSVFEPYQVSCWAFSIHLFSWRFICQRLSEMIKKKS